LLVYSFSISSVYFTPILYREVIRFVFKLKKLLFPVSRKRIKAYNDAVF